MSTTTDRRPVAGPRPGRFDRLGALTVRRRRVILVLAVLFVVVAGSIGTGVISRLSSGGFDDPSSPSAVAAQQLADTFDASPADLVVIAGSRDGATVDSPEVAAAAQALQARLAAEPGIEEVTSYWDAPNPALRSTDSTMALITAHLVESGDAGQERAGEIAAAYAGQTGDGVLEVHVSGAPVVFAEVGSTIEKDLARAESIAIPITMLLMLLVFGTLVAAGLPAVIGAVAVLGSFLALFITTQVTDVSIFAINLVTALGIGLGIDYGLFIVTRFREELAAGREPHDAVIRSVATAGRTVVFSGITVAISLSALLVFPQFFLRSFAYAGIATVALAVIAAVVVLPALLAVLGTRVNRFRVLRSSTEVSDHGFWYRLSMGVMRRPWPVLVVGVGLLVMLGLPFLRVTFGQTDDRVLPPTAQAAVAGQVLRDSFDSREADPLTVVATASTADAATRLRLRGGRLPGRRRRPRRLPHRLVRRRQPGRPGEPRLGALHHGERHRHLAVRRHRRGAVLERGQAGRQRHPRGRLAARRDARGRIGGGLRRLAGRDGRPAPLGDRHHRDLDVPAALPLHRLGDHPDQGAAAEHAEPLGDLRRDGLDLPGGPPLAACSATSPSPVSSTPPCRSSCSASPSASRWTTRSS